MLGMPIDEPMNTGLNYGSPTVNYVMGGAFNVPPNPIGATLNIGGQGYNYNPTMMQQNLYQQQYGMPQNGFMGGYYGGYNLSMNPYLYQQQIRAQEAAFKEQERRQSDMMKNLSKIVHKGIGDIEQFENFDDHLKQYDPVTYNTEEHQEELNYDRLSRLRPVQPNWNYINHCNRVQEENKKRFPDNMGLSAYLEHAGELVVEALFEKAKQRNRNGKLQYDTDQYRKILESHRATSSYFNSLLTGGMTSTKINIDDMEVELPSNADDKARIVVNCPSHMQEYASRKQAFLQSILQNATQL